jgi:hypothetical protein
MKATMILYLTKKNDVFLHATEEACSKMTSNSDYK